MVSRKKIQQGHKAERESKARIGRQAKRTLRIEREENSGYSTKQTAQYKSSRSVPSAIKCTASLQNIKEIKRRT